MTLPAAGKGTLKLDGTAIAAAALPQTVTKADIDASKLTYSPPANANGSAYASFTFKVNDGADDSATAYTLTINVTAVNDAPTAADGTITTDEDTDYTFAAADFNFTDTDTGDTLSSVKIVTLPATGKGTLELNGSAIAAADLPQTVTKADIDATKLKYSPPANANGSAYASFTFKVNDGADDSATAYTLTINVTALNDAATGAPTITGTATVGQTLTAVTTGILDADGLTSPTYTYQWIRVDGSDEDDISGATSSTYTLVAADQGKTIKVKVSFSDNAGNPETLTSAATAAVAAAAATNAAPTASDKTVTTDEDTDYTFAAADFNFADTDTGAALSSVKIVTLPATGKGALKLDGTAIAAAALPQTVSKADIDANKLKYSPPANANGSAYANFTFKVNDGADDSATANTMTIDVTAVNDPATGVPTITGTATVGQTLTAVTTGILDADGLTSPTYTYQWIRVDGSDEDDISGATSSTYTLVAADQGKTIKVKVSFTDDDSNPETLTSAATVAVAAATNSPATGAPTITGTARVGETLTAVTTGIMDADGLTGVSYTYQWIRVDGSDEDDISGATPSTYTLVAADEGKTIKVKVSFTDDDSNPETLTSAATVAVAAATNSPATGAPTITGTARVGETLTAVTTGIMDADGLTGVSYTYQWIRVDGSTETDISGATSSTYTVLAADEGKTIKVKVSFSDDADTADARTSDAFPEGADTILPVAVCEAPAYTGGAREIWVSDIGIQYVARRSGYGFNPPAQGSMTAPQITIDSVVYDFDELFVNDAGRLVINLSKSAPSQSVRRQLVFCTICDAPLPFRDTDGFIQSTNYHQWDNTGLDWSTHSARTLRLSHDDVAPTLQSSELDGAALTLTFSEDLDEGSAPATKAFAVAVAGAAASLSGGVAVSGATVTLTLGSAPAATAAVTLQYTQPAANPLRDAARNKVLSFGPEDVGYEGPRALSAKVVGATLTLGYHKPLDPASVPGTSAFDVTVDGVRRLVSGVAVSASEVTLTLPSAVTRGQAVTLTYTAPSSNPLRDTDGNDAVDFPQQRVDNDTLSAPGAPLGLRAAPGNAEVTLTWVAPADAGGTPITEYQLRHAQGASVPAGTSWRSAGTALREVIAGLANDQRHAFEVRAVNSEGAGAAARATATPIEADLTPPALQRARVENATLQLEYDEPLDTGAVPPGSAFRVVEDGARRLRVSNVRVSGAKALLTLAEEAKPGTTVTVSYTPPVGRRRAARPLGQPRRGAERGTGNQRVHMDHDAPRPGHGR